MQYTWDPSKAESNVLKHGVTFEEAATVMDDLNAMVIPQDHDGEQRLVVIGYSEMGNILFVVTVDIDEGEVLRIISARRATRHERKAYEGVR